MLIYPRYLEEIEEICDGEHTDAIRTTVGLVTQFHWGNPQAMRGLFAYCTQLHCNEAQQAYNCGCLTQVHHGAQYVVDGTRPGEMVFKLREYAVLEELSAAIRDDPRLADSDTQILPEDLFDRVYPLTREDKARVRAALLPYAEWQTRLREHFKDLPDETPVEVEV